MQERGDVRIRNLFLRLFSQTMLPFEQTGFVITHRGERLEEGCDAIGDSSIAFIYHY